jgi:hemolysin activation/secretion protein
VIYNTSGLPLLEADSADLYDFRVLHEIIAMPGQSRQVSERTVLQLTRCILSVYKAKGYSGIYIEALQDGARLQDDILTISITEASVTSITSNYFTPDNERTEEGYLKDSLLQEWTPVKVGEVGKQKELEDYVNLLNLNPDRYIAARVSKGVEPGTLAVNYDVYEANPWHWFLQMDNSGTKDRRYTPRIGLINTNLLGMDDELTVFYQAPWESGMFDEYSVYGSYDIPIMGPKLRLELFAGYSQFETDGGGGIDFLGHGSMYGGKLRYNAFQKNGWFFDLTTSLSREKSKVTSSIFSSILGSNVEMDLWGIGLDIHKRSDMANTSITFDRVQSIGGSSQSKFTAARTGADKDFAIYTTAANHSRYLDTDKIQRLSGSLRWIVPNERLIPAKMTTFGGMYTVRGYKESGLVADGGILASVQYEYDLVRHNLIQGISETDPETKPLLRKLAPLAFFDYGRAKMKNKVAGETGAEDLYSVGVGGIIELGDNFVGTVYYGFPLEKTTTTDTKDGRLNLSLMLRW